MADDPSRIAHDARAARDAESEAARAAASTPAAAELKRKLAAAYQVIADRGLDDGVAGHISVRVPDAPHHFWVATLGQLFTEVTPDSLALVNAKGEVVEGGPMINLAGFLIHEAIHRARPDILCAAHTHPVGGCTFSALGRPLEMLDQNSCAFHEDVAIYERYTGIVVQPEQSAELVEALGSKRALILQNHGLITSGPSVEQATIDMIDLERTCRTNLDALATGLPRRTIESGPALQARNVLTQPLRYHVQWEAMMRDLRKRNPVVDGFLRDA